MIFLMVGVAVIAPGMTILYLLMIMPRMLQRPDMSFYKKWFYAHRGLHDNASDAPENSMPAFAKAVEAGFGMELDIQLTKDGIPVVFHDFTLKRACGAEGRVRDHTFGELQKLRLFNSGESIPKFEEVLNLVAGRVPLIVEFKIERFDLALCPAADALLGAYKGPYCVESFNPLGLWWYRRHRPEICRGQLSDDFWREGSYRSPLHLALGSLLFNFVSKPDFVAFNKDYPKVLSRRLCRSLYRCAAAAWTIRDRGELERAKKDYDLYIFEGFLPEGKSPLPDRKHLEKET